MSIRSQDGAPSFNRPELVRYDSLRDSKDLGAISDLKARLSGFIGGEAGTQTLFFSFQLLVPGAIQVQTITDSKWTQRFVSVGLRSETGSIGLDERGNARGVDVVNTCGVDEALTPFPPGKYTVVVSCSQWQTTPFGLILRVNPTTRLYTNLTGRGGLGQGRSRLRVAVARLEGALSGRGQLRAPGSGLFSGRRDKPLVGGFLTGRGGLTGTLSIREPLRALGGCFLTGRGTLGRSTLTSNALGPTMWVSRLDTLTEGAFGSAASVTLVDGDYSYQSFYFLPAGSAFSQRRLAIVYRDPGGVELWMRISDIFVETNVTQPWQWFPLPGRDAILFGGFSGVGNHPYGIYAMRVRSDGTIAWKRQITLRQSAGTVSTLAYATSDITLHPVTGALILTVLAGAHPVYVFISPADGTYLSARMLTGAQLTDSFNFGGRQEINGPLIKSDGRLLLHGARFGGAPTYTWVAECDAWCTTLTQFWKYTDGTSLTFGRGSVIHPDGSVSLFAEFGGGRLRLNADLTIRGRVQIQGTTAGATSFFRTQRTVDSDGTVYCGGGFSPSITSAEQEGLVLYRALTVGGQPGRSDQGSSNRPARWFDINTRYAITSIDNANGATGLHVLTFGYDIDMAPTVVSGTGYSLTVGSSETVVNNGPMQVINVERFGDDLGGSITTPVALASPVILVNTDAPGWNPTFLDASTTLQFERRTSTIRRGTVTTIPRLRIKQNPAVEPDPYKPSVTLHLPGSGTADTAVFVDRGSFSLLPDQVQGGPRHSIEQARFPDIGGFFEPTSIRFDGTGDAIVYGSSPAFRIGRGDFTLETWIYRLNDNFALFDNALLGDPASHTNSFVLFIAANGRPRLQTNNTGRDGAFNNSGIDYRLFVPLATWTHIAVSREDTIWRIHVNGVLDSSGRLLDTDLTAAGLMIGRACQPVGTSYQLIPGFGNFGGEFINPVGFNGFLADIRFTLGIARYHRGFQPRNAPIQYVPTGPPLSLPAGTEPAEAGSAVPDLLFNELLLLARMNGDANNFFDDGPNNFPLIPFGNAAQITGGKWGGNQGAFDSFDDWLEVAANSLLFLGAGDFTVELWARRTGEGQNPEFFQSLIDTRAAEPNPQFCLRVNRALTGRQLCLYVDGAIRILGEPMVLNVRYHIAVVRRSGTTRLYMNGVPVGSPWVDATNYTSTTWTVARGRIPVGPDHWYFQGHINDLRVIRTALYDGAFTPPTAPIGTPPTATARYWRLVDLRPFSGGGGQFALSEFALHQGRDRLPDTVASSLPAPVGGLLTNTQDLSTTVNCTWNRTDMEQIGGWIQLDAGAPVTADGVRFAAVSQSSTGIFGATLQHSDDEAAWTTLGHVFGFPLTTSLLGPRRGFMPLPGPPVGVVDADFDQVVLYLRGNEPGAGVIDSSPRAHTVTNSNVSKTTITSIEGGQSFFFSAGANGYLTLGGSQGRSVFFSFGTGALTIEMDVFPLTIPPTFASLFNTNAIGGAATYVDGFQWVLTSNMKLDLFINNAYRGVSLGSVSLGSWNRLRLSRDAAGLWRYTINGVVDTTTFTNAVNISSRAFTIGRTGANTQELNLFNGYMDEIRVTRGTARDNAIEITNLAWDGSAQGGATGTLLAE